MTTTIKTKLANPSSPDLDLAAIRTRLLISCDTFAEPSVAFPVPSSSLDRAALAAMTDDAIRCDLAGPIDASAILRVIDCLGLPMQWVLTGDVAALLHYARTGVTKARFAA